MEVHESRKWKRESDDVGEPSQQKKHCVLLNRSMQSPATVRRLISEYVVEDVISLPTMESPKLIGGISTAQVPDQKSFTQHLDKAYDEMERKVKEALENIDSTSTTADVWTAHNSSYFGIGLIPSASVIAKLQFAAPGLLADIRMMHWLLKFGTCIEPMV